MWFPAVIDILQCIVTGFATELKMINWTILDKVHFMQLLVVTLVVSMHKQDENAFSMYEQDKKMLEKSLK